MSTAKTPYKKPTRDQITDEYNLLDNLLNVWDAYYEDTGQGVTHEDVARVSGLDLWIIPERFNHRSPGPRELVLRPLIDSLSARHRALGWVLGLQPQD